MKKGIDARVALACLLGLVALSVSSCIYVSSDGGWDRMAKYEREVELSAPLEAGSTFTAETRDGSITLEGTSAAECRLLATIRTHALTEERARELNEQIEVRLEPEGGGLRLVVDRPSVIRNASYGVSLVGTVPTRTGLNLVTSDGSVHLARIEGHIDARTSDGSIQAEDLTGDTRLKTSDGRIKGTRLEAGTLDLHTSDGSIELETVSAASASVRTSDGRITLANVHTESLALHTSDGSIHGREIATGQLNCRTSDGSIHIECTPEAPSDIDATISTSDGSITFVAPQGLSAMVEASTSDGSIHTDLPITVAGKVNKSLRGTIGAGEGRLILKTHDGSITIR